MRLSVSVVGLSARRVGGMTVLLLGLATVGWGAPAAGPPALATGTVLDLDIATLDGWAIDFEPVVESYLELVVEQRSLDVLVTILAVDNRELATVDGPSGIGLDERLALRLDAGRYRLRLTPAAGDESTGRVRLRVDQLRPWATGDAERVGLVALGQEATHLDGSSAHKDWQRSHELSLKELEGWRSLGEAGATIRTLNRITSLERAFGDTEASIAHGREAVRLSLASADSGAEAASRYWLAQSLNREGLVEGAESEFDLGLAAARRAGDLRLEGRILNWQARLCTRRGELDAARVLYEEALERRRRAHDVRGVSSIVNNLGTLARDVGDFPTALAYFREAIESASRQGSSSSARLAVGNLAGLLLSRGQYQEALDVLERTLVSSREAGDLRNEAFLGSQLASMLLRLGDHEQARGLLLRSLEIERQRREAVSQVDTLFHLSRVDSSEERYPEAQAYLDEAYDLTQRHRLHIQATYVLRALADLDLALGRPAQAVERLKLSMGASGASDRPIAQARSLMVLAEARLAMDDPDSAMQTLAHAAAAIGPIAAPETRFDIARLRARVLHRLGRLSGAIGEAEQALVIADSLRSSLDDADMRASFQERVREAHDFYVGLLLEMHDNEPGAGYDRRAFLTFERAKARSLSELLTTARFGAEQRIDPALLEIERSASALVAQARERLASTADSTQLEARTRDFQTSTLRLAEAEAEIRRSAPQYADLRYGHRHSVEDIQRALGPESALIEYALRPEGSVAWVLTSDQFSTVRIANEETISDLAIELRDMLPQPSRRAFGQLQRRSRLLGELLLGDVLVAAAGRRHLVIVPDGPLAYVPFEALRIRDRETDGERYLIEDFAVSYSPSAGVLLALGADERNREHDSTLAAFADPSPPDPARSASGAPGRENPVWKRLPGSRREVAALAAALGEEGVATFVDAGASERRFKSEPSVRKARWIHVASHALVNEAIPGQSAVVLATDGESGEDGYLTVQEVFSLSLEAELVVLSGCETALGHQLRSEGLLGLTRAFLYAGARGLQVSLWKVADLTTPRLMASLYQALSRGLEPAAALREAKLESLRDPERAHPFHWASFVHVGEAHKRNEDALPSTLIGTN